MNEKTCPAYALLERLLFSNQKHTTYVYFKSKETKNPETQSFQKQSITLVKSRMKIKIYRIFNQLFSTIVMQFFLVVLHQQL